MAKRGRLPKTAPSTQFTSDSGSDFEAPPVAKRAKTANPPRRTRASVASAATKAEPTPDPAVPIEAEPVLASEPAIIPAKQEPSIESTPLERESVETEVKREDSGVKLEDDSPTAPAFAPPPAPDGKKTPTAEQQKIIDYGASLSPRDLGHVCRIVAGAGTGKTTTLQLLAETLVAKGHKILYIVYNKAAQADAEEKFAKLGHNVVCKTMHAAALGFIERPVGHTFPIEPVDDNEIKKRIEADYSRRVEMWLSRSMKPYKHNPTLSAGQNAQNAAKFLKGNVKTCCFYIFKTLETWYRSVHPREKLSDPWMTYYPAKLKHKGDWGFPEGKFYLEIAAEIWDKMWTGNYPIPFDAFLKFAQLGHMRVSPEITTILMDESQDSSACQLDLFVTQLATNNTHTHGKQRNVFLVGDAAQSIYFFRGARPKVLAQIHEEFTRHTHCVQDFPLTTSFRFGENVAAAANTLLWMKSRSPQAKDFNPYYLKGGGRNAGTLVEEATELPYPYTIIARSGLKLIMKGLEAVAKHAAREDSNGTPVKIAINGNASEYKTKMKDAMDVFRLWDKQKTKNPKLAEWDNYDDFVKDVEDREMSEFILMISLIESYKERTPEVIAQFEEAILEKKYSIHEADVILTTAHQAKGLEYDNVEVADDFIELGPKEKEKEKPKWGTPQFKKASQVALKGDEKEMEWKLNAWGDDLNLWYVAVTRPKKMLKLPGKWWKIMEFMDNVQEGKQEMTFDGKKHLSSTDATSLKKLFDSLDGYLKGSF
ncbi:F-box DNA helicase 1 [Podochytrium sp. JEL0797]|nr:F-box DNA helicase 1 [Podochytrium sp. JEL0797]